MVKEHIFSKDVVRGRHVHRDAMAVSESTPRLLESFPVSAGQDAQNAQFDAGATKFGSC